jgi:hypothetical protein
MSATKQKNIKQQILAVLEEHGPQNVDGLASFIKNFQKKSVNTKAIELMNDGLVNRDTNMVYTIAEGVTKDTPVKGGDDEEDNGGGGGGGAAAAASGTPLDARAGFEQLLKSVAVKPPEIIPTIASIFFGGDIDSLPWLNETLRRSAAGYVQPNQIRVIMSYWSQTRGLPYRDEDYGFEGMDAGKGGKPGEKETPRSTAAKVMEDAGVGYQITRDKDGTFIAKPGGPLSYEAALDRAERQNAIRAMNSGTSSDDEDDSGDEGDSKPAKGGKKQMKPFEQLFMEKVLDKYLDGDKGANEAANATIARLEGEIHQMREAQQQERFDRLEGMVAQLAARNPWDDPVEVSRMRQALGVPTSQITDSSPAVQIIKDSSEKIDKNVDRMMGLVERIILQGDVFRPEETRTPAERENKAGALLEEAQARERSREVRKRAFSI